MGFETPTEIQQHTIPLLLSEPQDIIGLAQTGTGKTAAFGLPLIDLVEADYHQTQALILAPTRELAQQIASQLDAFSKYKHLRTVCVFGGASISGQISQIRRGAHIIVATPGRLIDLTKRGAVKLDTLEYIVLDEADEMLNMGFKEDLDWILAQAPETKLTWLFSATMPAEIRRIVKTYMSEPAEIKVNQGTIVNTNIEHQYAVIKASDRIEAMRRILDFDPDMYCVVFCRTKRDTQAVAEDLVESGYAAEPLHGDLSQAQRDAVMKRFRSKTLQVLIATDVAARGIDVDNLTHVIHFALPDDPEYYTHRSGRTARAGKKGISLSLITKGEMRRVRYLENKLGIGFVKAMIPAAEDIMSNRISHWAANIAEQEVHEEMDPKALKTALKLLADYSKEDLITKLVSREFSRLSKSRSFSDLNDTSKGREGGRDGGRTQRGADRGGRGERPYRERDERGMEAGMHRYFISVGTMDRMNKGQLLRLICDNTGLTSREIGRMELDTRHAYFDVKEEASSLVKQLNGFDLDGRALRVNRDDEGRVVKKKKGRGKEKGGKFGKKGKSGNRFK
jgi:ATP-dependent RNA helicase DeaD